MHNDSVFEQEIRISSIVNVMYSALGRVVRSEYDLANRPIVSDL